MQKNKRESYLYAASLIIMALIFFIIATGCASLVEIPDPDVFYKRDLKIQINGQKSSGVMVAQQAKAYQMEFESKGKLDLFTLQSCHREISREGAGRGGIFGNNRKTQVEYVPANGIENQGYCPVLVAGYDKKNGRHSWGFIDFVDADHTLDAEQQCNGEKGKSFGASICQSKAGLIQSIKFPSLVAVQNSAGCQPLTSTDIGDDFEYKIQKGRCIFEFAEVNQPFRTHRLTTIGYEKILIRGE